VNLAKAEALDIIQMGKISNSCRIFGTLLKIASWTKDLGRQYKVDLTYNWL
jgi:hypothetical protein